MLWIIWFAVGVVLLTVALVNLRIWKERNREIKEMDQQIKRLKETILEKYPEHADVFQGEFNAPKENREKESGSSPQRH